MISKRRTLLVGCGFGFCTLVVLGLTIFPSLPQTTPPFAASPNVKSVVEGNTTFAVDLYQKLKVQPGNLFFSPYSISTAMAMTCAGARNRTESEIAGTLHFNLPRTKLHAAFGELAARLSSVKRGNNIKLGNANSLWCPRGEDFSNSFLNLIRSRYNGDARPVDFKNSPEEAVGEINDWAALKTEGRINRVIEQDQITPLTQLILCNAIYFKAKWKTEFKTQDTKPTPFFVATNQTATVPMMTQKSKFKWTANDNGSVAMLEMPYAGSEVSMIVLLPNPHRLEEFSLADLESILTAESLRGWLDKLDQARLREAQVYLPRFTSSQSFNLANQLIALGMRQAFDLRTADFSDMGRPDGLFISEVAHKAFIAVDEAGTEAAAATTVIMTRSEAYSFVANHPFIFLIRDNASGTILFLGRVIDPTK